jgi:phage/plasmid-like protein (TIGR03299 family)
MNTLKQVADQAANMIRDRQSLQWDVAEYGDGRVVGGVFSANRKPWHFDRTESHVLSQELLTIEDVRRAFPKIFEPVTIRELFTPEGRPSGIHATFRGSEPLAPVTSRYGVIQDEVAAQLAVDVVDAADAVIETAVLTHKGARAFFVARLPEEIRLAGRESERVQLYLIVHNSHDGSSPLQATATPVRAECDNTQRFAFAMAGALGTGVYKLRHTRNAAARINDVRQAIGLTYQYTELLDQTAKELLAKPMTRADLNAFLETLLPTPKDAHDSDKRVPHAIARRTIQSLHNNSPTVEPIRGTAWGALQAVVEYSDHYRLGRNTARATAEEHRLNRILTGSALNQRALALLS